MDYSTLMYSTNARLPPPVNTVVDCAESVTTIVPAESNTAPETNVDSAYRPTADTATIDIRFVPFEKLTFMADTGSVPVKAEVGTAPVFVTTLFAGIGMDALGDACERLTTRLPGI
jgi:hypothetical protein